MLKKFIEGLVFGAGFAIAFMAIWFLSTWLVAPRIIASQIHEAETHIPASLAANTHSQISLDSGWTTPEKPFHELGVDEQIRQASVIALARYERAPDGEMKAIIREFLKKDPNVDVYYNVGDEFQSASRYPRDDTKFGDGVVIFFTGSPAQMMMSMSYYGDRITGLGDIPIALFRDKCKKPGS
jgi:hypothetical protein